MRKKIDRHVWERRDGADTSIIWKHTIIRFINVFTPLCSTYVDQRKRSYKNNCSEISAL